MRRGVNRVMNLIEICEKYVNDSLPERRKNHTFGVRDTAVRLAEFYDCNVEKAEIAALLHDVGKYLHKEELLGIIKFEDEKKAEILRCQPEIYHGHASAYLTQRDIGIQDQEILDAIKYHTTGREDMSLLEKIIYIADYIEPNRDFPGVDKVREMAFMDLDRSVYVAMNNTITYITKMNGIIDFDTILARNYFLMEWGKECERSEKTQK